MTIEGLLKHGVIGSLQMPFTRADVIRVLGEPPDWTGKPPNMGKEILNFRSANVWWYEGEVGFRFDGPNIAEVSVVPSSEAKQRTLLKDIATVNAWRIGDAQNALEEMGLTVKIKYMGVQSAIVFGDIFYFSFTNRTKTFSLLSRFFSRNAFQAAMKRMGIN